MNIQTRFFEGNKEEEGERWRSWRDDLMGHDMNEQQITATASSAVKSATAPSGFTSL